MKIFLATKNEGKIKDFKKLTNGMDIEVVSILDNIYVPDVEENGITFEENSAKKAIEISKYIGIITISDDSGLCVDYLNGAPGIYSSRYSGENATDSSNIDKLLEEMKYVEKEKRTAYFISVVSIAFPDGKIRSFRGEVKGEILFERDGNNGFGYDPIFFSYELGKSFGQSSLDEKKSVSHRGRAFNKLKSEILDKI
ncbi:MAG: XTP/dITP diphosphatase [Leptotrichiaceae bacterium]|nr:XTP/dITP diphosphatase [Leptotrichiaceae bacterium]MBP6281505.1 XTP/dITP diphosphatase [Leptotrichiaceae bacterium]MBP7100831.1 XTP/dITP diphosphatase [Leptotrichiaceae bacterium]MBP7725465.1 XTP/dITP diphosphatase [Leptotrichiaceae bacterium]MBP9628884.1 XTP/dITP diphosphatase [Leptotrichiaceae bacterium]